MGLVEIIKDFSLREYFLNFIHLTKCFFVFLETNVFKKRILFLP